MEALNVHSRLFAATVPEIQRWVERLWSGTDQDAFPRDFIPSFRRNPEGEDPDALIPGVTRLGHGPTRFRLEKWDGRLWEVSIVSTRMSGWHGFVLTPEPGGTRITHTLKVKLWGPSRFEWPLVIRPIHDWAVEALFDRLEQTLATGRVPSRTTRPQPWWVALLLRSWRWLKRLGLVRRW